MKASAQFEKEIEDGRDSAVAILGNSGPKTKAGKQRVSMNGVTHGLTGQNVFLEAGEYPAYMRLGADYIAELRPVGVRETQLAQKIIDLNWRLNTIAAVENNLFNTAILGSVDASDHSDDKTFAMRAKADAWKHDCEGPNAFEKLGRYESRLQRSQYKMSEEMNRLQAARLSRGPDTFDQSECRAWRWYTNMLSLHTGLAAVRLAETEAARTAAAAAASAAELLCKKEAAEENARFAATASSIIRYAVANGFVDPTPAPPATSTSAKEKGPRRGETLSKANRNQTRN